MMGDRTGRLTNDPWQFAPVKHPTLSLRLEVTGVKVFILQKLQFVEEIPLRGNELDLVSED